MLNLNHTSETEKTNFRFNILTTCTYLVGIIILIQLFNIQILKGTDYRQTSNTKLTRESKIEAVRGSILDSSGNVLVSTDMTFSLEMYKTKVEDRILNSSISVMTNILNQNGDEYNDNFPITTNPFEFQFNSEEKLAEWKKKYKIPETASAQEAFYLFRDKYEIESEDIDEIRRILAIRYEISTKGYSSTKSIQISKQISRNSAVQLQENSSKLTGVNVVVEPVRVYHTGNLASHIIGYMGKISEKNKEELAKNNDTYKYENDDKIGQAGIEKVFEEYLRGTDGEKQIDMDVEGTITGEYTSQEAIGGSNIVLTIDANLQEIAERALAENIEKIRTGGFGEVYDAKGGAVVVTNVKTGEILAMASNPDYEPAAFYNGISKTLLAEYNEKGVWRNKTTQNAYAPGSTYKMVTAIAGLQEGAITATEQINDTGIYPAAHKPHCWYYDNYKRGHGYLNVYGAIQKSCNYFFYEVGNRIGIDNLARYSKFFGLGTKTGIELNGESSGTLAERILLDDSGEPWTVGDTIVASIGQGYNEFTPVQMAKYISILVNGGNPIDLTLVKSVVQSNGTQVSKSAVEDFVNNKLGLNNEQTNEDIQLNQDAVNAVLEGMRSVAVDPGGTAYNVFRNFEIEIGGKTGSAETHTTDVNAWFVGYAPFDDPEIAVVVLVENGGHGNYTAEVVREIISEYFGMNVESVTEDMSASSEMESFR